jgi:hypothetical protein
MFECLPVHRVLTTEPYRAEFVNLKHRLNYEGRRSLQYPWAP